jgi:MOSC domain-containing protein YiiM
VRRLVSIQVGRPRTVEWRGKPVTTSIFKEPAPPGPVAVRRHNLAGDEQSDLSVHGGPAKAVYAYPSEHYAWWREQLPGVELPWGAFGENLTTEGLLEDELCIGDRLRIGSAELQVTQPRVPCFKLGIRFGMPEMVKRFLRSGRSGFYLAVVGEGEIAPGDPIEVIPEAPRTITVAEVARLYREDGGRDPEPLRRAIAAPALPEEWREGLRARLAALEG